MKKNSILKMIAAATFALLAASCAEKPEGTDNDNNIRYINKWMEVNYPEVGPSGRGVYILKENAAGKGDEFKVDAYAVMDYTVRDMEGNINITTYRDTALLAQLGGKETEFCGALVKSTSKWIMPAGLIDAMTGMKTGDERTVLIPSWLVSTKNYENPEEYLQNKTDQKNAIWYIKLRDVATDVNEYQEKMMLDYISKYEMTLKDTVSKGFFFKTLEAMPEPPADKDEGGKKKDEPVDTSYIMINYTGTLIYRDYSSPEKSAAGKIFDTSVERTAKDAKIFNPKATYSPKKIVWGEKMEETTLDGSKVISGFSNTLWQMKKNKSKKAVGIFWADMGYGSSGQGESIPGYSPLVFEIERVVED